MYAYTWDPETGGLLLNSSPLQFSKEPRPVYYQELDILGFDKFWEYEKHDSKPYMWAEANNYIYRGRLVAIAKGGSLCAKPEIKIIEAPEAEGKALRQVDIRLMVKKNEDILSALTQLTIKQIYGYYQKYLKRNVDVFYVAFSGGKDSIVTLDLVQKALPHNAFKVLFGDTNMEFPDTYRTVDHIEKWCADAHISFIRAKSSLGTSFTWSKFGPPATVNRWCCGVHKTAPQIIALRKLTGKNDFTGMAFIGVRASESVARSNYDYISLGEKHKGQYSCNPILDWNSAELYAYIFAENLYINEAYKKGNRRAGCLMCPRAAERSDYYSRINYPSEFNSLLELVEQGYAGHFATEASLNQFIVNGGWKARKNGRDLNIEANYNEFESRGYITIVVNHPTTDWRQWIKTIGILQNEQSPFRIDFRGEIYTFEVDEHQDSTLKVQVDVKLAKAAPNFVKLLKNVFRKTASCVQCRVCEADCHHGALHMGNGTVYIDDTCHHCSMCHKVEKGCLVYKSLERPKGILKMNTKNKSLNCYSHHAPKMDWFSQFFKYKEDFANKHSLGTNMYDFFKRFLKDAELFSNNTISKTATIIDKMGLESESSWALMLSNLVYTPQFNWLTRRVDINELSSKEYIISLLVDDGAKESWVADIWSSFTRISELPFSSVGFGRMNYEGKKAVSLVRTPWTAPDPKVLLYSLYKFAEACGGYYQFTLSRLYDENIDSNGVSPVCIFGIEEEKMKQLLTGLSANYNSYINAAFTLDLDNITLKEDKTSQDVLDLF